MWKIEDEAGKEKDYNKMKEMFLAFAILAAAQDLRRKQIDLWVYVLFSVLAFVACLFEETSWFSVAAGSVLGAVLLACGRISGGAIGDGDGLFFLISGLMLGFRDNLLLLGMGIFLCGLFSTVLYVWNLLYKKRDVRKLEVPFLPFVAVCGVGNVLWEILR